MEQRRQVKKRGARENKGVHGPYSWKKLIFVLTTNKHIQRIVARAHAEFADADADASAEADVHWAAGALADRQLVAPLTCLLPAVAVETVVKLAVNALRRGHVRVLHACLRHWTSARSLLWTLYTTEKRTRALFPLSALFRVAVALAVPVAALLEDHAATVQVGFGQSPSLSAMERRELRECMLWRGVRLLVASSSNSTAGTQPSADECGRLSHASWQRIATAEALVCAGVSGTARGLEWLTWLILGKVMLPDENGERADLPPVQAGPCDVLGPLLFALEKYASPETLLAVGAMLRDAGVLQPMLDGRLLNVDWSDCEFQLDDLPFGAVRQLLDAGILTGEPAELEQFTNIVIKLVTCLHRIDHQGRIYRVDAPRTGGFLYENRRWCTISPRKMVEVAKQFVSFIKCFSFVFY